MSESPDKDLLPGNWIRSEDEDRDGRRVFRTAAYEFPAQRAPRDRLTIKANGDASVGVPGPADRSATSPITWTLDGRRLTISGSTRLSGQFEVVDLNKEKLVLRPCK